MPRRRPQARWARGTAEEKGAARQWRWALLITGFNGPRGLLLTPRRDDLKAGTRIRSSPPAASLQPFGELSKGIPHTPTD
jgi:hypothetical protein